MCEILKWEICNEKNETSGYILSNTTVKSLNVVTIDKPLKCTLSMVHTIEHDEVPLFSTLN